MLDSCHSGTGLRGGGVPRAIDAKILGLDISKFKKTEETQDDERADTLAPDGATPILLSGCRADQTSSDSTLLMPNDPKIQAQYVEQVKKYGKYCGDRPINAWTGALTFSTLATLIHAPEKTYA